MVARKKQRQPAAWKNESVMGIVPVTLFVILQAIWRYAGKRQTAKGLAADLPTTHLSWVMKSVG